MNVPPQFTAAGVGSAIPIDSLGKLLTSVNYDFVGTTTRAAITIYATTVAATVVDGTLVSARTMAGTTIPEMTITGTAGVTSSPKKGGAGGKMALSAIWSGLWMGLTCFTAFIVS